MAETNTKTPTHSVTMSALNERQANFVREYVARGGKMGAGASAALAAGYGNGDIKNARVRASELLRHPKVLSALRDELARKLSGAASLGVNVLIDLALEAPPSVRLQAAKELIDRGYGPVISRNAHVVATTSIEDILSQIDNDEEIKLDEDFADEKIN